MIKIIIILFSFSLFQQTKPVNNKQQELIEYRKDIDIMLLAGEMIADATNDVTKSQKYKTLFFKTRLNKYRVLAIKFASSANKKAEAAKRKMYECSNFRK